MIDKIKLLPEDTIKQALEIIDKGAIKLAIVVDNNNKLLGTITDGDIRRAILKGYTLDDEIKDVYHKNPFYVYLDFDVSKVIKYCIEHKIYQIPLLNSNDEVIKILFLEQLLDSKTYSNKIVLMLGGLGTRLRPLTQDTPKPMLKIGNKPILETIVKRFKECGFTNFVFCVNYKSEVIKEYFKDGKEFGVNIEYIYEQKRLGTAGALSLAKELLNEPFFVMNGDLLTTLDFAYLFEYYKKNNSIATMVVKEHTYEVPFGVVNLEGNKIISIKEKPQYKYFVSAGIYILDPKVLEYVPFNEFYDMPELFNFLVNKKYEVTSFHLQDYWCDVGRIEEYKKANEEYSNYF